MNLEKARFNMVEQQIRPWDVLDPKVLDLFMDIPRHEFVSESQTALAYTDIELPLGEGQHMLPPRVEGRVLQALDANEEDDVLLVGTGSGYTTALLASAAKQVTSVELFPSLQAAAAERLTAFSNIELKTGDAAQDWQDDKMYDVIFLTAALGNMPEAYKRKLNLGGRLAVTVGKAPAMVTQVLTRVSDTEWETETLFETDLAYFVNGEAKAGFSL